MTTISKPAELNFLGATAHILASGGALGLVHMDKPAGDMPPLHVHRNEDEGFYVLDGELTLYVPGDSVTLRAGEFFLAPRGVPHAYEAGPDGARVLVSSTPSGFERFVADVADLDAVDPATLTAVAATHGIEILGPPGARP
jgi:quercetin dioxygenase-like cupin family protein